MRPRHVAVFLLPIVATTACVTMSFPAGEADASTADPCDRAMSACQSAGFSLRGGAGKDMFADCLGPVSSGSGVAGVTISPRLAAACVRLDDLEVQGTDETSPDACGQLFRACRAGGYHEPDRSVANARFNAGRAKGDALIADCVSPLLLGRPVEDVGADAATIDACLHEPHAAPAGLGAHGFSPCHRVDEACEHAGFRRSRSDPSRDIERGCVAPLKAGQAVPGVKLDPAIGLACTRLTAIIESGGDHSGTGPCGAAFAACTAAGYFVGGSEQGIGMQLDCLTPILLGHVPASVKLDAAGAEACRSQPIPRPPCSVVSDACQAAGYYPGGMVEGKGILTNCQTPLLEGSAVEGVQIDPAVVRACAMERGLRAPEPRASPAPTAR